MVHICDVGHNIGVVAYKLCVPLVWKKDSTYAIVTVFVSET